jgi:predicted transcriptional regulator
MGQTVKKQMGKKRGGALNQGIASAFGALGWAVGKTEKTLQSEVSSLLKGAKLRMEKGLGKTKGTTPSGQRQKPAEMKDEVLSRLQNDSSGMTITEVARSLGVPWQRLNTPMRHLVQEKVVARRGKKYYIAKKRK